MHNKYIGEIVVDKDFSEVELKNAAIFKALL